ncbi:unnamed protein product [Closterium sp. NIES-54]
MRPTPPVALPCPVLPVTLPCWLRAALPCPSRRLACRALPCPACAPPCWLRAVLPCPRTALPLAAPPCPAHAPPCWPHPVLPCPRATLPPAAPPCWPPRRPALPARRPAGRRATLPCRRATLLADAQPCPARAPPCWPPPRPDLPTCAALPVTLSCCLPESATRSQWLTRDAPACLAVRNHLPLAERAHFGQHKTAKALYDAVVARYSSPATAARGRLLLPYLFPELSAFAIVEDLITHLRTSDTRFRAALKAELLDKIPPPMYITLYFIVTRLPYSLRALRDHFLALDPTDLTIDLLEKHLLAAETSILNVGAACGTPRTPFFEGCSPSPLAPSYAFAAAVDILGTEEVGAASAPSGKHCTGKGKGGKRGGGGSGGGGGGGGGGGSGGGGGRSGGGRGGAV